MRMSESLSLLLPQYLGLRFLTKSCWTLLYINPAAFQSKGPRVDTLDRSQGLLVR